jgi:YgiT-type zinc finger domain-containing protein
MKKNNRNKDIERTCQACGGPLHLEKVNLEDYQGGKLYMMEKVPAYVCQDCGEVWVPDSIMQEFEKMIEIVKRKNAKRKIAKEAKPQKNITKKRKKAGK